MIHKGNNVNKILTWLHTCMCIILCTWKVINKTSQPMFKAFIVGVDVPSEHVEKHFCWPPLTSWIIIVLGRVGGRHLQKTVESIYSCDIWTGLRGILNVVCRFKKKKTLLNISFHTTCFLEERVWAVNVRMLPRISGVRSHWQQGQLKVKLKLKNTKIIPFWKLQPAYNLPPKKKSVFKSLELHRYSTFMALFPNRPVLTDRLENRHLFRCQQCTCQFQSNASFYKIDSMLIDIWMKQKGRIIQEVYRCSPFTPRIACSFTGSLALC